VVSALLCDSILSGDKIDEGFAATGDMTAAGEVRPIGGLAGKIRGAIKKKCTLLGAPKANEASVNDLLLIEGIEPLYQIQIFTIATFDEARAVAMKERSSDMQKAIDEFAMVQTALHKDEKFLNNARVREKLRNIVKRAPNHVRDLNRHIITIQAERTKLMRNKEVREELMLD
jgi:predicted ATP-dependent protease